MNSNSDMFIGTILGFICATILFINYIIIEPVVTIKTDIFTNTKYVKYQNTIYTLTPYKKIIKE